MIVAFVHVHVKPDQREAFLAATLINVTESRKEPGVIRFDLLQQDDDPTKFTLIEAFRSPEGQAAHRETPHYQTWRDTVADMMAAPRSATRCIPISPASPSEDYLWGYPA